MNANMKKSSEDLLRLEYLLKCKNAENAALSEEIKALRQINSICASYIVYLMSRLAQKSDDVTIKKAEINNIVGKYFVSCEDSGDSYKICLKKLSEESDSLGR